MSALAGRFLLVCVTDLEGRAHPFDAMTVELDDLDDALERVRRYVIAEAERAAREPAP